MKKGLLYILVLIILSLNSYAALVDITTPRNTYLPKETVQTEIIINIKPLNEISIANLQFTDLNNNIIPLQYFLEKISNQQYIIYFNLPDLDKGAYKFQVKNVQYIEDDNLRQITEAKEINVYNINPGFDFIASKQNLDGSFNSISETALAALALKNIYPDKAEKAISYLINNQDSQGCYPRNNCNVKDTAFALLALNDFNQEITKTKNWLLDAQNNFNIGKWPLILNSEYSRCAVNNKEYEILNKTEINIENPNIIVNCTLTTKITLTHSYLGNIKTIYTAEAKLANINIENSGCFGKFYRSSCDYESTGLAIYTLQESNEKMSAEWFEKNPSDVRTLDQALLYILKNNDYSRNWLLNNIIVNKNAWPSASSSLSQNIDIYSSIFATLAIKEANQERYKKSLTFLEKHTTNDVLESALILYFFFKDEKLQPIISIFPGVVNKKESFKLIIKNQNNIPTNIEINAPNFTGLPKNTLLTDLKIFDARIPKNIENFNIEVKYNNSTYLIPVITLKTTAQINISKKTNLTSNITLENEEIQPIIPPPKDSILILSNKTSINEILFKEDSEIKEFKFTNKWNHQLNNITFILTKNLKDIVEVETNSFSSIYQDEIKTQRIIINKNKNALGTYNGEFIIISNEKTITKFPITLTFTQEKIFSDGKEDEAEILITETTLKEQNKTKLLPKTKKKKSFLIWLIPFIILLIISLIIFFLARGKGKKTFDKFLEDIKRE